MKRIIAVLTLSIVVFFTACSTGPDQALLGSLSTFENSWSSLVNEAGSLGNSLKTEVAKMQNSPELQAIMSAKVDAKKKNSLDSMLTVMRDLSGKAQAMTQGLDATTAKLNETTSTFTAWKEKVTKGEVKGDEAKTQLAGYETQMGDIKNQLSTMQQSWGEINGQYGSLLAAATALVSSTATTATATPAATAGKTTTNTKTITTKTTTGGTTQLPKGGGVSTTTTTTTTTSTANAANAAANAAAAKAAEELQKQKTRGSK